MSKWLKVETIMRSTNARERDELLGFHAEGDEDYIIRPVVIDITRIETYTGMFGEGGVEIEGESIITMHSGAEIGLKLGFPELDRIMRKETT